MEVRSQEKGTVMPNSLGYNPPNRDSSSKIPSASIISAFGERKTLENHPLYHHHQLNPQHQSLKPTRDSGLTPDPTLTPPPPPASAPSRSISRSPPPLPPPPPPPPITSTATPTTTSVRYRECLKNHAASMGGLVVDGCGEFMPSGEEGTPEALKCAACECHRNFHRKEIDGEPQCAAPSSNSYYKNINNPRNALPIALPQQLAASFPPPSQPPVHLQNYRYHHGFSMSASTAPIAPMMMTFGGGGGGGAAAESSSEDLNMFRSNLEGHGSMQPSLLLKKRFRTKFSQEQKDKMMEFAEKIGWKIQKQDEQEVQQFCSKVGIKRKIFKVWMHNNKQATKKMEM